MTDIPSNVFDSCSGLQSVTIPEGVKSIDKFAFTCCSSLTSIIIPESVTSIGINAFNGCIALSKVELKSNTIASKAYKSTSSLKNIFGSQVTEYVLSDEVKSIGNYAFSGCSSLTSFTIPESVTSIGNQAFSGCNGLTSIIIPESVTSIGDEAFLGCHALTSITIPSSVTSIGFHAFSGCSGLTSVNCLAEQVPQTDALAFGGLDYEWQSSAISNATLYVPGGSIEAYKAASPWNSFKDIAEIVGVQPYR